MSRRCHTVRVDGHEKMLLLLYRTVDPQRRDLVDAEVWRLHTSDRMGKEIKPLGAGSLPGSYLAAFFFAARRLETRESLPVINEGDPPPTEEHYEKVRQLNEDRDKRKRRGHGATEEAARTGWTGKRV